MSVRGETSRAKIVRAGVELLSAFGCEAISFGELSKRTSISKSGFFAHFSDKEDLQRSLLDAAQQLFLSEVVHPALAECTPLRRLRSLFHRWLGWAPRAGLPGGCPFAAAAFELDDMPGALRDHLVDSQRRWMTMLAGLLESAIDSRELRPEARPTHLAFEVMGFYLAHHYATRLLDDPGADASALAAFEALLSREAIMVTSSSERSRKKRKPST